MKILIRLALALALMSGSMTSNTYAQTAQEEEAIVAYSDTTGTAEEDAAGVTHYNGTSRQGADYHLDEEELGLGERWLLGILGGTVGVGATVFALIVVILVFLFLCSPFIIIALFIWYMLRRNRQRLDFARKAMETGQPIPQEFLSEEKQTDEYMWRKGVKRMCLGAGLIALGAVIRMDLLIGIGILVCCIGVGQAVIGKTSRRTTKETQHPEDKETDKQG